jgi:hypothetical protein
VKERELRDALEAAAPDDPAARERSWRVVRAAYAGHVPRRRRRPWPAVAAAVALSVVAAAGAAAAGAPRSDVGRWVRDVIGVGRPDARPVLARLPGGGRMLVEAGDSAWVVAADGAKRRLGAYAGASWSPHGRFVVAWRDHELAALDPRGRVRWSIARAPEPVTVARWAPVDGFRIAYVAGASLRVVDGDGTGDRRYGAADGRVAPAWRPDAAHVLAYADRRGRIAVVAVDERRLLWRSARVAGVRALDWAPDGSGLLVAARRRVLLFGRNGTRVAAHVTPPGAQLESARWGPDAGSIALVRRRPASGRSELVLLRAAGRGFRARVLFSGPGRFRPIAWAPGGRALLLPYERADQWLFLYPRQPERLGAVAGIARQFRSGTAPAAFPRSVEWCCAGP